MKEVWIKTPTSPQICCRTTVWKVSGHQYNLTFILARMLREFMSGGIRFMSFICLFIFFLPDNDVIVTLLQYFVWCISHSFFFVSVMKINVLTQHWTTHLTHPLTSDIQDWKHAYVPTADILSTWCKLICVDKQRNSIPREHLRYN